MRDERSAWMSQGMLHQQAAGSQDEAVRNALAHMVAVPAWKGHPKLLAAQP